MRPLLLLLGLLTSCATCRRTQDIYHTPRPVRRDYQRHQRVNERLRARNKAAYRVNFLDE